MLGGLVGLGQRWQSYQITRTSLTLAATLSSSSFQVLTDDRCMWTFQSRCCWKLSGTPAPTPHQHWYHPRTCRLSSTACPPELTLKYRRRERILKTREGICTGGLPAWQVKTTPPENRQVVPEKLSVVPQKNAKRTGTMHLFIILFFPLNSSSQNNTCYRY